MQLAKQNSKKVYSLYPSWRDFLWQILQMRACQSSWSLKTMNNVRILSLNVSQSNSGMNAKALCITAPR